MWGFLLFRVVTFTYYYSSNKNKYPTLCVGSSFPNHNIKFHLYKFVEGGRNSQHTILAFHW